MFRGTFLARLKLEITRGTMRPIVKLGAQTKGLSNAICSQCRFQSASCGITSRDEVATKYIIREITQAEFCRSASNAADGRVGRSFQVGLLGRASLMARLLYDPAVSMAA